MYGSFVECVALSTLNPKIQFTVAVELSFILEYNITEISKCFKSLQLAKNECFKDDIVLFFGVMVSTQDFDSCDTSSILGRT